MSYDENSTPQYRSVGESQSLWNRAMSYDYFIIPLKSKEISLNPFGTGQCLTTVFCTDNRNTNAVSIPLEQGNVLRRIGQVIALSQFDCLNPFGTGQCLTTQ